MTKAQTHQVVVNENDLWETPPKILQEAIDMYGINPTLDVCATDENHKLDNYFTPEDDALTKDWDQDFFMNPPYSEIYYWMQKAYLEHLEHNVTASILVFGKLSVEWFQTFVYNRPTDTWWGEFKPFDKRIRFLLDGIEPRYCKYCKTRFTEEIDNCKTCKHCKLCKKVFLNGLEFCKVCDSKLYYQKIGKSSPTYDSAWIVFRKKEK